ncbi:hypothetical protein N7449_003875 [Penicillium cf. viridicatum]|uniref:FAD-dependent oxidoreductase 2 FAD-binding domain-containing protein n=1 Tax=Penicillium cf. viridicatum TaxID=2972119 RepID=A0A9W9T4Y9_9EURO|nr:hypothetical protein N7449_003875 [Penicillium cf. viridicatum]
MPLPQKTDILVIGSGNAGLSAALSAAQTNPTLRVTVIDKSPVSWAGGNSYFTAGAFRTVHNGLHDLLPLVNNTDATQASRIDMPSYTEQDFTADLQRMTGNRTDPTLSAALVHDSRAAVGWLAANGIRFQLSFNRQAYEVNGRIKFWGGLALKTQDGGKGLVEDELRAVRNAGVDVFFDTAATALVTDPTSGAVIGVEVVNTDSASVHKKITIAAGAVILAAGGFEANPQLRAQWLGPGWDSARVRGTPYNTGEMLRIAQRDVSAKTTGNWSGCHKWDPAVKDGLATKGLAVPKSNWALPIDKAPFLAVKVTAGITFTFGGLAVNPETAVVISETTNDEVPGLYCVGEMLGGIFYDNYPGGSGLTSGTVFGRRAGRAAAERAGKSGRLERL